MLTQEQAMLICENHELEDLLRDIEMVVLLEKNNPNLLEAYYELFEMALGGSSLFQAGVDAATHKLTGRPGADLAGPEGEEEGSGYEEDENHESRK